MQARFMLRQSCLCVRLVCPSVYPSVSLVLCVKLNEHIINVFSRTSSNPRAILGELVSYVCIRGYTAGLCNDRH